VPASTRVLTVGIDAHGTNYAAELPIGFSPDGSGLAQRLVNRVSAAEVRLGSAVVHESLRGSPTPPDITVYEIQAPDRFAYQLSRAGRPIGDTIIIGTREWTRAAGQGAWQGASYGPQPWSASSYLSWWGDYADSPRLLDLRRVGSLRIADVATLDEIPGLGPVWLRLELDLTHDRLLRLRMITAGHFMTQAWGTYDQPQRIEPPGR
jgi:hypothetical protein